MGLFGRRSPQTQTEKPTRLFFASDFHGSERTFRKFLNAGKHYGANILIMGGDIVGKLAIPIIREGQGGYRAHLMGKTEHLDGADALAALEQRLGTLGYYSKIMDQSEYEALRDDTEAVEAMFRELARKRLESWVDLAETRLADTGIRCFRAPCPSAAHVEGRFSATSTRKPISNQRPSLSFFFQPIARSSGGCSR